MDQSPELLIDYIHAAMRQHSAEDLLAMDPEFQDGNSSDGLPSSFEESDILDEAHQNPDENSESDDASSISVVGGVEPNIPLYVPEFRRYLERFNTPAGNGVSIAEFAEGDGRLIDGDYTPMSMSLHLSPSVVSASSLSSTEDSDPDDTRKFYLGLDTFRWPETMRGYARRRLAESESAPHVEDRRPTPTPSSSDRMDLEPSNNPEETGPSDDEDEHPSEMLGSTHERNLTVSQFIILWLSRAVTQPKGAPGQLRRPSYEALNVENWERPTKTRRPQNYAADFYDLQQIPWREKLHVSREDARALRDSWYTSYHNVEYTPSKDALRLPNEEKYFREKAMYMQHKATIEHFQLRNLISVTSHNTVCFASDSRVLSWVPAYNDLRCVIDLRHPTPETGFFAPVKISTMRSSQGITIAGGFCGEYSMHVDGVSGLHHGYVTQSLNGITNHIEIIPARTRGTPLAVFASNDKHVRILDCATNQFIAEHSLEARAAVNCAATSSDGRLRVLVGDSPEGWVVEAETGRPVQPLRGHLDYGFACAWAPDMRHLATSNQDKTVKIWDARMWRVLTTLDSDVAGYRSLHFSPVGGGSRTLLLCEPADRIVVVNAQTYQTRQVHDFFGEIAGAGYTPDGGGIWVANADDTFGGFMEFERRQWGQRFGVPDPSDPPGSREPPCEWRTELELVEDERCLLSASERRLRFLRGYSDAAHDELLL